MRIPSLNVETIYRLLLIGVVFQIGLMACSTSNSEAPGPREPHPAKYILKHGGVANGNVSQCRVCHGIDYKGIPGVSPSCLGCHLSGPPFVMHPIPYIDPYAHGSAARASQVACLACHGESPNLFDGGIVADPELFNAPTGTCSSTGCHPAAKAHPTNWQGGNDPTPDYVSSHRAADNTETACGICHNVSADAPGPAPRAPSCFSAEFLNSDGSATGCHASGPGAPHAIPYTDAVAHGPAAKANLPYCQECHGEPGTTQFGGGIASTGCSSTGCHTAAGAHPVRWQGSTDITPDYMSSHRNAGRQDTACSICHDFTQGRTAPDSSAPSCFSAEFTNTDNILSGCHAEGPAAPHAIPFIDPVLHGPEAKADLSNCQECHASPFDGGPGSNPRFNLPIGTLTNGCESESCHSALTAHPSPSWTGIAANSHKTADNFQSACALCHGANLLGTAEGGVGKACDSCHLAGDPLVEQNCASCHNNPPDQELPAGNQRPNRLGSHEIHNGFPRVNGQCIACHNGSGSNTAIHFDDVSPANVELLAAYGAETGGFSYDPGTLSCSGVRCHGGQPTVSWTDGTINVDTDCLQCHVRGTSQYNSYNSGEHEKHVVDKNIFCTVCHATQKLALGHFSGLDTVGFEQPASQTLQDNLNFTPGSPSCGIGSVGNIDCHENGREYRWDD